MKSRLIRVATIILLSFGPPASARGNPPDAAERVPKNMLPLLVFYIDVAADKLYIVKQKELEKVLSRKKIDLQWKAGEKTARYKDHSGKMRNLQVVIGSIQNVPKLETTGPIAGDVRCLEKGNITRVLSYTHECETGTLHYTKRAHSHRSVGAEYEILQWPKEDVDHCEPEIFA